MDIRKMKEYGHIIVDDGLPYNVDGTGFLCKISSAVLTHLQLCVSDYYFEVPSGPFWGVPVVLDTPSLRYLMLKRSIQSILIQSKIPAFLDEANIQIIGHLRPTQEYCDLVVHAIAALVCAKSLTLNEMFIHALSYAAIKVKTKFTRLKRLEVFINGCNWSSLQDLIMLSDNLELLVVKKHPGYAANVVTMYNSWKMISLIPKCLSHCLRTVVIDAYDGYPDELAMVDYILRNGSVLEVMHICFGETISDFKRRYELVQEISAFPRKSPVCEVIFC